MREKEIKSKQIKRKNIGRRKSKDLFFYISLVIIIIVIFYPRFKPYYQGTSTETGEYFINDPDSCYHASRIIYIAKNNMKLPFYDPLLVYPYGDIPIWSPLYDWACALPAFIIGIGKPSNSLIINTSRLLTILFGLLGILFISLLIYNIYKNKYIALIIALLTGVVKSAINISNAAIIDHNSFLFFIFALLLYLLYLHFAAIGSRKLIMGISFSIAALFWAWPGSYIYITIIVMVQLIYSSISRNTKFMYDTFIIYIAAGIIVLPLAAIHHSLGAAFIKFDYVSFLTVMILIGIGTLFLFLSSFFELKLNARKSYMKIIVCLFIMILIAICSFNEIWEGMRYASAQNRWLASIHESASIFYVSSPGKKVFTLDNVVNNFGYLIFLYPILLILIITRIIKIQYEAYSICSAAGIILPIYMVFQQRFSAEFTIAYGLTMAALLYITLETLKRYKFIQAIIMIALILMLSPLRDVMSYEAYAQFGLDYGSFKWLREFAKPEELGINIKPKENDEKNRENGVIAPWQYGHHIKFYSKMPVVADNFGYIYMLHNPWEGFNDAARFFLTEDENEAIKIIKKYKSKYILVSKPSAIESYPILLGLNPNDYVDYRATRLGGQIAFIGKVKPKFMQTVGFKLSALYGSSNPYENKELIAKVEALKHFRLIYEQPGSDLQQEKANLIKIYMYVEGEKLPVPINGDKEYSLEGLIIIRTGYGFYYRAFGKISDGVIVPYPLIKEGDLPYAEYYRVTVEDQIYEFKKST